MAVGDEEILVAVVVVVENLGAPRKLSNPTPVERREKPPYRVFVSSQKLVTSMSGYASLS